jgi:hypothetical protein
MVGTFLVLLPGAKELPHFDKEAGAIEKCQGWSK